MLDQARGLRLLMPSRSVQRRWARRLRLNAIKPIGWHFVGTGFMALALAGGVAAVSGKGGSEPIRQANVGAAQRAAPEATVGPPAASSRPTPVSAGPSPSSVQRATQQAPPTASSRTFMTPRARQGRTGSIGPLPVGSLVRWP